jgi:hypothetical protein
MKNGAIRGAQFTNSALFAGDRETQPIAALSKRRALEPTPPMRHDVVRPELRISGLENRGYREPQIKLPAEVHPKRAEAPPD